MADNPHYKTPEEMSALACPFGIGNNMPSRTIKMGEIEVGKPCISVLCAAWRWASWEDEETEEMEYSDDYGYCGNVGE